MSLSIYTVDAFADKVFSGNPAAVCLPAERVLTTETMQKIARELNQPATAFVTLISSDRDKSSYVTNNRFGLRWFSLKTELPLCGHGTFAAATVLFNRIGNKTEEVFFETPGGLLSAKRSGNFISIFFPENKPIKLAMQKRTITTVMNLVYCCDEILNRKLLINMELGEADEIINVIHFSVKPIDIQFSLSSGKLLVVLPDTFSRQSLEELTFDINSLLTVTPSVPICGVIISVRGTKENGCTDLEGRQYDFISRYFTPWLGHGEDAVTGSAHTVLAPYWSTLLNKKEFYARQCSRRGGDLHVTLDNGQVEISGTGVVLLEGTLLLK